MSVICIFISTYRYRSIVGLYQLNCYAIILDVVDTVNVIRKTPVFVDCSRHLFYGTLNLLISDHFQVCERLPFRQNAALVFLLLIGVSLTAEAFDQHIPKGYIYFTMAFSVLVEFLNIRVEKKELQKFKEGE
ncbi:hypothetical protein [Sphingobacterium gobiense]|uniref:hypothetical protein n=1 Tax=Sphingobacterium gobiense TaxID=1382456 RepID=UPI001FEBB09A|nr:hypothetical protein [Sphingobacterium gobiense]